MNNIKQKYAEVTRKAKEKIKEDLKIMSKEEKRLFIIFLKRAKQNYSTLKMISNLTTII